MATLLIEREIGQTWSFRGTKSRNKVTVGEPAVGSLLITVSAELIPEKESSVGTINHLCTVLFFGLGNWCLLDHYCLSLRTMGLGPGLLPSILEPHSI